MLMPWQGVAAFAIVGLVCIVGAGRLLLREQALRRRGVRTHAVIVGQDEHFGANTGGGVTISNRSRDNVWSLCRHGTVTTGTVVGETTSSTREGLTLHHPVVRFSVDERQVEAPSERGTLRKRAEIGQSVTISHDADDPYRMLLVGDAARPVFWVFTVIGAVIFAGGTALTILIVQQ